MDNNKIEGGLNFNNLENGLNNIENKSIETQDSKIEVPTNIENNIETKIAESTQNTETKIEEIKEINNDKIKEDVAVSSTSTAPQVSYVDDQKTHMNESDLELEKKIEEIINDDLLKVYESLNEADKEKFKKEKYEASVKIIVILKSAGGNIKKAIKNIFDIVYKLINSLKNIKNRAFVEKITKIKVEKILQTQEEDLNK